MPGHRHRARGVTSLPTYKDTFSSRLHFGRATVLPGAILVFLLSCVVFWLTTRAVQVPPAWRTFEFCQYAEIGRNLLQERAFETNLVEPMALAYIDRFRISAPTERWPVLNRYPLPCFVIAGLMGLLGPTDFAAACSNGLAISLLASLAYVLAARWYGLGWAMLGALLFVANPSFYGYFVLMGTPDIWFAFLFLLELVVWAPFALDERLSRRRQRLAGFAGRADVPGSFQRRHVRGSAAGLALTTRPIPGSRNGDLGLRCRDLPNDRL